MIARLSATTAVRVPNQTVTFPEMMIVTPASSFFKSSIIGFNRRLMS
jgi:hypothetical protein